MLSKRSGLPNSQNNAAMEQSDWLGNLEILKRSALFRKLGIPECFEKITGHLIGLLLTGGVTS